MRFYQTAAFDLLEFIHGHYGNTIHLRPRSLSPFQRLKNGPSLFLTAHFHNWELMGAWMTQQGVPLLSGARPLANAFSQSLLVKLRARLGIKILFKDMPLQALRHIQAGNCFALLWDQRVKRSTIMASFFGQGVLMDGLPLFLAEKTSAPVFFGALLPGGELRLLQLTNPSCSSHPNRNLARRYHRVLETLVRSHPIYWYGLAHGRFQNSFDLQRQADVSRETSVAEGVMVSRETLTGGDEG